MALLRIDNGNSGLLIIDTLLVTHVEAAGNYCALNMADGTNEMLWFPMKKFEEIVEEQLPNLSELIRVGKSTIVNRLYIYRINPQKGELEISGIHMKEHVVLHASEKALTTLSQLFTKR